MSFESRSVIPVRRALLVKVCIPLTLLAGGLLAVDLSLSPASAPADRSSPADPPDASRGNGAPQSKVGPVPAPTLPLLPLSWAEPRLVWPSFGTPGASTGAPMLAELAATSASAPQPRTEGPREPRRHRHSHERGPLHRQD